MNALKGINPNSSRNGLNLPNSLLVFLIFIACNVFLVSAVNAEDKETAYQFDDEANHEPTPHPDWFEKSFYILKDDIGRAKSQGKKGLMVFIGTEQCSYCRMFITKTLADKNIQTRLRNNYNSIGIELFSDEEITDLDGQIYPAKEFVYKKKAYFSPTLIFYDINGNEILKIVGYYPPDKFGHVLDYLIDEKYKTMRLGEYLANNEKLAGNTHTSIKKDELFTDTRTDFRRKSSPSAKPLVILLEREKCEPCWRFHKNVLSDATIRENLLDFERAQLDIGDTKTLIITPYGQHITPYDWAKQLKIEYAPAFLFFDETGKLVLEHDADVQVFRVKRMLKHAKNKAYLSEKQFNRWYADELRRENKTYKVSE